MDWLSSLEMKFEKHYVNSSHKWVYRSENYDNDVVFKFLLIFKNLEPWSWTSIFFFTNAPRTSFYFFYFS